jgi:hypothetical protein
VKAQKLPAPCLTFLLKGGADAVCIEQQTCITRASQPWVKPNATAPSGTLVAMESPSTLRSKPWATGLSDSRQKPARTENP